jgi:hypothetical protein
MRQKGHGAPLVAAAAVLLALSAPSAQPFLMSSAAPPHCSCGCASGTGVCCCSSHGSSQTPCFANDCQEPAPGPLAPGPRSQDALLSLGPALSSVTMGGPLKQIGQPRPWAVPPDAPDHVPRFLS